MKIRRFTPKQTFQWIGCGVRFWKRKPLPWLLAGLLLSVSGLLLLLIPFVGPFFLAFFMPVIYASMYNTLETQLDPSKAAPAGKSSAALFPFTTLFRTIVTEQGALVILIPGTLAFITALIVFGAFTAIGGPYTTIHADVLDIGAFNLLRLVGAYLVAYLIYIVLMAHYFYIVPLCLRDDVSVKAALVGGAGVARKNALSVSMFLTVLFLPLLVSAVLLGALPWVGAVAWILCGTLLFPLAAHCAYCGNRLTFVNQAK
ncbi:MAG: hypothetical protein LJE56_00495 [Acidiferrobacterales bacterium]|jgi:hypothetical protein|nr:hypothetical protein [Acidiferrobacterales bacterium]